MQLVNVRDWNTRKSFNTRDARDLRALGSGQAFSGIAIGPMSDESIVGVDDLVLQAGRVIPLEHDHYQVKQLRPSPPSQIETLQLMLFENAGELAGAYARPSRLYSSNTEFALLANNAYGSMTAPFAGRKQAKVSIISPSTGAAAMPTFTYYVYGSSYHYALRRQQLTLLKTETSPTMVREPAAIAAGSLLAAPGIWNYTFYIGGDDNAEEWDLLVLYIQNTAGEVHSYLVDISVTGETGAR